jgi:SAM-dependent methyltransferase
MKIVVAPDNLAERAALVLGLVPVTLMDTHMSFIRARAIMTATKLGIFEAMADAPLSAGDIAARCNTSPFATSKLLNALVGAGYVQFARKQYALRPVARKWLLGSSPTSLRDKVLFEFLEWSYVEGIEEFVRSGAPLDLHATVSDEGWGQYQRAMRALSGLAAPEIVKRTPVPARAKTMLDIGGSHGYISVAICRRHAGLRATVLDLPNAVRHAAPILAQEGMGDRVVHWAGDALREDLGSARWDFIYVSQLLHHFDEASNRALISRIARSLRPGGLFVILELVRQPHPGQSGQVGALLDLYFALTSQSGTWSVDEMSGWQREAGLSPLKHVALRTVPGAFEVMAVKR